mmetsp:Transcript_47143/g.102383  ORF Transcript_47143/g.102383 Transcript_47143/m.102383 type:complete len:112 (+) Transcript_47143:342-677(+)
MISIKTEPLIEADGNTQTHVKKVPLGKLGHPTPQRFCGVEIVHHAAIIVPYVLQNNHLTATRMNFSLIETDFVFSALYMLVAFLRTEETGNCHHTVQQWMRFKGSYGKQAA